MAVYKDKKRKTWYFSTYIKDRSGKSKRVMRRGFDSQREAKEAEADIIFNAKMTTSENPPFGGVLDEYLSWYEKRNKSSTVYRKRGRVELYIRPFFDKRIQNITKRDVVRFHDFLLEKLAVSTAQTAHKDLSSILNYAISMEYIEKNVAREVGNIDKKRKKHVNYWTIEEFKEFMKVVDNDRYRALFLLLFYSGARIGEVLALTWADLNDDTVRINKRYYNNEIDTTKSDSSTRNVKIPKHTVNALNAIKNDDKDDYYIFGSYYKPMNQSSVNQQFYKYKKASTVKSIRLHDFRHSHATYLINRGHDIQIVSKRLGHSKTSITYDIYAHLYPNKEDEAVEDMENDF